MKTLKLLKVLLVIVFLLVIYKPLEALQLDRFKLTTNTLVQETYDDNVFLEKHNKNDDLITIIKPRLLLSREGKKFYIFLEYDADLRFYDKYTRENQYYQFGSLDVGMKRTSKSNIGLKAEDTYSYIREDPREKPISTNLIEVNNIIISPYITQEIGEKFEIGFSYIWDMKDYKEDGRIDSDLEDSESNSILTDFAYNITEKFSLIAEYRFTLIDFKESTSDYTEHEINSGFRWNAKNKIEAEVKIGYGWNKNDADLVRDYITSDSSINILFISNTLITLLYTRSWKYTSTYETETADLIYDDLSATVTHYLFNSKITLTYGGAYILSDYTSINRKDKTYSGNAGINWRIFTPFLVSFEGKYYETDYTYNSVPREDKTVIGRAGVEWDIFKPILLSLYGSYSKIDYEPEDREDELYDGLGMLAYRLTDNFSVETSYQYLENKSIDENTQMTLEENEYIDNRYSIGLRIIF